MRACVRVCASAVQHAERRSLLRARNQARGELSRGLVAADFQAETPVADRANIGSVHMAGREMEDTAAQPEEELHSLVSTPRA
eukprot:COSAG02_NODE_21438_length_787_cov_265.699128_1_plen_82_part_01